MNDLTARAKWLRQEVFEMAAFVGVQGSRPTVIIADTVKGKGISFMEARPEWHYTTLHGKHDLIEQTRAELA